MADRSSNIFPLKSLKTFQRVTQVIYYNAINCSKSRGRSKRATKGGMSTKRMAMIYGAIGRLDLHILKIANSWFDLHNHLYKVYKYFNMSDCCVNFCNWNS